MATRLLSVAGCLLAVAGAVLTGATQVSAGHPWHGVMTLSVVLAWVYGIRGLYTTSEFGPARLVGTIRAVVVLLIGLVMLGVGLASVGLFS